MESVLTAFHITPEDFRTVATIFLVTAVLGGIILTFVIAGKDKND